MRNQRQVIVAVLLMGLVEACTGAIGLWLPALGRGPTAEPAVAGEASGA